MNGSNLVTTDITRLQFLGSGILFLKRNAKKTKHKRWWFFFTPPKNTFSLPPSRSCDTLKTDIFGLIQGDIYLVKSVMPWCTCSSSVNSLHNCTYSARAFFFKKFYYFFFTNIQQKKLLLINKNPLS